MYFAIPGFAVIIRYTSVMAHMKFLDPLLSSLGLRFDGLKCRWYSPRFCMAKILGVNNEGKGRFVPKIFILTSKHSLMCLCKH